MRVVATVLQVAGLLAILAAAVLASPLLGVAVAGVGAVALGVALERD
jgi:hypothetical protein